MFDRRDFLKSVVVASTPAAQAAPAHAQLGPTVAAKKAAGW